MNDEHDELASELHTILGRALPEAWSDERLERIAESAMAGAETYEAGQLPEIETLLGALPESWSEERLAKIADAAIARAEEARVGDLLRAAAPPAWDEARVERIAERVMGRTTFPRSVRRLRRAHRSHSSFGDGWRSACSRWRPASRWCGSRDGRR